MDVDKMAKLTEGQRECLRLVLVRMGSKEIGRQLAVSPHTVDQRLRLAMQTLGVANRFEAARALARFEHGEGYQSVVYQTSHLPSPGDQGFMAPPDQPEYGQQPRARSTLQEEQIAFDAIDLQRSEKPEWRLPIPKAGREQNDLRVAQRLGWIAGIAIGAALSFGMLLSGLDALSRALQ